MISDPAVPPPFVAPRQPRLEYQLFYEALGTYHSEPPSLPLTD